MEIIEKRMNQRNDILHNAIKYADSLKFKCTAILIGSYARGDFNLWSDIDILIIGDFQGNPLQRLKNIDFPPGYETILLTIDEVNKLKSKNSKFIKDAFNDGINLRDDYLLFSSNSR